MSSTTSKRRSFFGFLKKKKRATKIVIADSSTSPQQCPHPISPPRLSQSSSSIVNSLNILGCVAENVAKSDENSLNEQRFKRYRSFSPNFCIFMLITSTKMLASWILYKKIASTLQGIAYTIYVIVFKSVKKYLIFRLINNIICVVLLLIM